MGWSRKVTKEGDFEKHRVAQPSSIWEHAKKGRSESESHEAGMSEDQEVGATVLLERSESVGGAMQWQVRVPWTIQVWGTARKRLRGGKYTNSFLSTPFCFWPLIAHAKKTFSSLYLVTLDHARLESDYKIIPICPLLCSLFIK